MTDERRPRISGWCSGFNGCTSQRAHATCQSRLDRGLLDRCDCPQHAGHTTPEAAA